MCYDELRNNILKASLSKKLESDGNKKVSMDIGAVMKKVKEEGADWNPNDYNIGEEVKELLVMMFKGQPKGGGKGMSNIKCHTCGK